jgi:serine/threonine protein kinase
MHAVMMDACMLHNDHGRMHAVMMDACMLHTGPLPEAAGAKAAEAVLTALAYLNKERKQIHRDVKPSNILVNAKGMHGMCL